VLEQTCRRWIDFDAGDMLRVEGLGIDNVGATANDQRVIGIGMGDEGNRRAENMRW